MIDKEGKDVYKKGMVIKTNHRDSTTAKVPTM